MNESDKELADFQACLLDALHRHESAADILTDLTASEVTLPFRDYISGFEPEMLEVAAQLVKKWGVKKKLSDSVGLQEMPH